MGLLGFQPPIKRVNRDSVASIRQGEGIGMEPRHQGNSLGKAPLSFLHSY
jgi:hypothetical protein